MRQLIPQQFLFRFVYRCRSCARLPSSAQHPAELSTAYRLPYLGEMDNQRAFAEVRIGWNEHGLGLAWRVPNKEQPLYGEPDRPNACDGMCLWLDLRDTRNIHRATRYCCSFNFLAHNGEEPGIPQVLQKKIPRAVDDAPLAELSSIRVARFALDEMGEPMEPQRDQPITSYQMEVFLPAEVLPGFDHQTNSRLGFCYRLRDKELGDQLSAPGAEFPYWEDPSLWSTLELGP
jgi:hypothetical protein